MNFINNSFSLYFPIVLIILLTVLFRTNKTNCITHEEQCEATRNATS